MGLDWCIQTKEGSEISKCQIVGAKKVGEVMIREEYIERVKDYYKAEYLEKVRTDDKEWKEIAQKWDCDSCPGDTSNICKNCPIGGIGCPVFGFGGCNFRGKITGHCLGAIDGFDGGICWEDCKSEKDWKYLIDYISSAIGSLENGTKIKVWKKEEAIEHLKLAKYWLNFWYKYVKEGQPIELYAWY